jgi:hypothetical protein
MINGFIIKVPAGTNFQHILEFYESDGSTPRDVSSYTVALEVAAGYGGDGQGFTVAATGGGASHKRVLEFTKEQLVKGIVRDARVTIDTGGANGPEDAATGKLRVE